jgi:hypothetical protein
VGQVSDYFRAPDAREALRLIQQSSGPFTPEHGFDGVEAKWVDPWVALGRLIAFILEVPFEVDVNATRSLRPRAGIIGRLQFSLAQWRGTGYVCLDELADHVCDALASVDDSRIGSLAVQWAGIEEFHGGLGVDEAADLIQDFVALARRTHAAGHRIYWFTVV